MEEQIASARFTAKNKNNTYVLIANLSNTFKSDFYTAVKYINQLKETKEIKPEDNKHKPDDMYCPSAVRNTRTGDEKSVRNVWTRIRSSEGSADLC